MDDTYWMLEMKDLMKRVKSNSNATIFIQPIEEIIASFPKYSTIIEHPIDLIKIENKLIEDHYNSMEEFKSDIDLLCSNCKVFNSKNSWAQKVGEAFENFFNREFKKSLLKIEKYQQNLALSQNSKKKIPQKSDNLTRMNPLNPDQNIQIISSIDDEKILKKIRNLFLKLGNDLDISEENREEIINVILKSITKRNKSLDQIYDDTMKFLTKHLKNSEMKSFFSKKFRKLLRVIKEEQNAQQDGKAFNIKINLNENEEKREEKDKLDKIRKEVLNFIDNQKITSYVMDIKSDFLIEN